MKLKKGNRKGKSDVIYAKKSKSVVKKENPFEAHVNREKFAVLNRKTHHSFGKPLISRQNAFEKRKQTIGAEYKVQNKSNLFEDRRKAGNKKLPKESIYNLNDSEKLTHHGQTLEQIEQFDDVMPDDNDEEISDEELRLDANFTKVAHFGGGNDEESGRDRKTAIEELIADSKKRKAERMKEHEEMLDLTNKLDNDWRDLSAVIKTLERTETPDKPEPDEYDRLVKEMIFAPRGEPTQKLKSEEEMARIEKEKLDNLEQLRLRRMHGEDAVEEIKSNHRSADDLDDGYFLEPVLADENDDNKVLCYPINPDDAEENVQNESSDDDDDQNNEESEIEESDVDSLEDLKADETDSEDCAQDDQETTASKETKAVINAESMDHIPFTISFPADYEKFLELMADQSIRVQSTIIERIIKTNHPKLHFSNKKKMVRLFAYLLQYLNDIFSSSDEHNIAKHFKVVNYISPLMYDLIQMNPEECSNSFLEVIKEKYEDFEKNQKVYPKLDTAIFFKFLRALFPTSDFRHPVVTPCYFFLDHILSKSRIKTRCDVTLGLYLATLTYDYQKVSKRFLPSVTNFLKGICNMGIKKSLMDNSKPIPPFKKSDQLLVVVEEANTEFETGKLGPIDFIDCTIDDDFKIRALNTSVSLTRDFIMLYSEHVGVHYLIDSFEGIFNRLSDEEKLPLDVRNNVKAALDEFSKIKFERKFKYPEPERKALPMLRTLEPRFESVHTDRRQMYCQSTGIAAEKKKLQHQLKREKKAAKRELIRDNEFIAKIKHKRMQKMDVERKEKVRRILHEGSLQQGEYRALSRTKGRKGVF